MDNLREYIKTALWAETDDEGIPLDDEYEFGDVHEDSLKAAQKDIDKFLEEIDKRNISTDGKNVHIIHDFWLTRNGHGAGFWDGDYDDGDRLTELSKEFGSSIIYIGDDDLIHLD